MSSAIRHQEGIANFGTVGELRKLLDGVPDHALVSVSQLPIPWDVDSHCILSTIGDQIHRPDVLSPSARQLVDAICICEVGA